MSDKTGGPAFPKIQTLGPCGKVGRMEDGYGSVVSVGGMTLLDWFAGQALAGMCANPGGPIQANGTTGWGFANCNREYVAGLSYGLASAMLAEKALREATGKDCSQVPDHSPDAGKMARLEEENRELVEALQRVLDCIIDTRGPNAFVAVADAKEILAKHQKRKKEAGHE